jgi:hypothetical protein
MEFSFLNPPETSVNEMLAYVPKFTDMQLNYDRNKSKDINDLILQEYSNLPNDFPIDNPNNEIVGVTTGFTDLLQDFKPDPFLKCNKENKQVCDDSKLNDFPSLKVFKPKKKCKYHHDSSITQTKCIDV